MEAKKVAEEVVLNSGQKMAVIGLGSVTAPLPPNDVLVSVFMDAIRIGYRHFDTAELYGTEEALGQAVAKALKEGLLKDRHEIFITSKLWNTHAHHDFVLPALQTTLRKLGLEYVDLYLIHWPVRLREGIEGFKFSGEDVIPFDTKGTWEAMEECQRLGLAKSIGVCNFGVNKLTHLLQNVTIPPAVNQVEMSPLWQQGRLREFCKQKGIHVSAWSPLGAYKTTWGTSSVMENPILRDIAKARNKTVAQIALRWIYEQGASAIVKSFNTERMKQNIDIFDFELSMEELQKISQLPQRRIFRGEMFLSENGPYKSLEELWDGDI